MWGTDGADKIHPSVPLEYGEDDVLLWIRLRYGRIVALLLRPLRLV
jgi:hypothetical protein